MDSIALRDYEKSSGKRWQIIDIFGERYQYDPRHDLQELKELIFEILSNGDYGVVNYFDGFRYLKKGYDTSRNKAIAKEIFGLFEEDQMNYIGNLKEVFDLSAGNKKALYLDRRKDEEDAIIYGPYISLPPGDYETSFRIKMKERVDGEIAKIDVSSDIGRRILIEDTVRGEDFRGGGISGVYTQVPFR